MCQKTFFRHAVPGNNVTCIVPYHKFYCTYRIQLIVATVAALLKYHEFDKTNFILMKQIQLFCHPQFRAGIAERLIRDLLLSKLW